MCLYLFGVELFFAAPGMLPGISMKVYSHVIGI